MYHGDLKSVGGQSVKMIHFLNFELHFQANILVNSKYRAIIIDFGSARYLAAKDRDEEGGRAREEPRSAGSLKATFDPCTDTITLTCDHQYTLRWAAPEVLKDEGLHIRSDIWSFGWVAYEVN